MTSPWMLPGALRSVSLGSLAVRPVLYTGDNGGAFFEPPAQAIEGLSVCTTADLRRPARFHPQTNVYGFTDLKPGVHRVHLIDSSRRARYLPRAVSALVPDRSPLAAAIRRGAAALPDVPEPPLVRTWIRPAPGSVHPGTALWGLVRDAAGAAQAFAWIRVDTPQGRYTTYADERGEYLAPLAFLRAAVPSGDDMAALPVAAQVTACPRIPAGDPLAAFPVGFDDLEPGTAPFNAVYSGAVFDQSIDINVGTTARLDLQPA